MTTTDEAPSAPPATRWGSKKGPDYRLRGLETASEKPYEPVARPPRRDKSRRRHRRRLLIGWILALSLLAGVAVALRVTLVQPFTVRSSAMAPTLQSGDRVVMLRATRAGPIKPGEIIVVNEPNLSACGSVANGSSYMVLRVVAMPGQTIWSYGKQIFINGSVLRESAWYNHKYGQVGSAQVPFTTVPAGSYYLMGDNRSQSCDSRAFGAVPGSAIVGKVVTVLLRAGHPYIHPF